jgi:hypothetical protein
MDVSRMQSWKDWDRDAHHEFRSLPLSKILAEGLSIFRNGEGMYPAPPIGPQTKGIGSFQRGDGILHPAMVT